MVSVEVCGLAMEYCVKYTANDLYNLGFDVKINFDCTRAVDPNNISNIPGPFI